MILPRKTLVVWTHLCYHYFRRKESYPVFNIEFYSNSKGVSELWDFLEDLQERAVFKQRCPDTAQTDRPVYPAACRSWNATGRENNKASGRRHMGTQAREQQGTLFLSQRRYLCSSPPVPQKNTENSALRNR